MVPVQNMRHTLLYTQLWGNDGARAKCETHATLHTALRKRTMPVQDMRHTLYSIPSSEETDGARARMFSDILTPFIASGR